MALQGTISAALAADLPILFEGAPGTGKTAFINALAEKYGAHVEVLIGSTMDPTDLGYLTPTADGMQILPPPWARRIADAIKAGKQAWLFLDELSCAPPSVQAALLRVVNERMVGDLSLKGCRILGAMNPADQAAGGYDLPPPAANRWMHVAWTVDASAWIDGMLSGWGKPQTPELAAARGLVASYIRKNPSALLDVPRETAAQAHGWPSPRTWDHLARFLGALGGMPGEAGKSEEGAQGADGLVGRHASSEWLRWLSEVDLADPEDYLSGKVKLPQRGDRLAAALDSIVVAVLKDVPERPKRIERGADLIDTVRTDVGINAGAALVKATPQSLYKHFPQSLIRIAEKYKAVQG